MNRGAELPTQPRAVLAALPLPARCSNLTCPNKPHEGEFVLLETEGLVVGGNRTLRLYMCRPCAEALSRSAQQGVELGRSET